MPQTRRATRQLDRPVAELRIRLAYLWRHGRAPDLARPARFTELVQVRKLLDRNPLLPILADKVAVKRFVADRIGADWVTPSLWQGRVLPARAAWPAPFVVKARHGCNQNAFVMTDAEDWAAIRLHTERWVRAPYGVWLDEWAYASIPRGLLVEPFVGAGPAFPVDYKFYVFGGRVEFIQVHLGRGIRHRWLLFDRDWRRVSAVSRDADPARPLSLSAMAAAAEALAAGIDFVRVDLYDVAGQPRFGEMTFYPGSGLDPFDPPTLDRKIGAKWLAATHDQSWRETNRSARMRIPSAIISPAKNSDMPSMTP